jgi:hypothetical protein
VDLARSDFEVDVVIGDDPGESLGDSLRLQDDVAALHGLNGHAVNLSPTCGSCLAAFDERRP